MSDEIPTLPRWNVAGVFTTPNNNTDEGSVELSEKDTTIYIYTAMDTHASNATDDLSSSIWGGGAQKERHTIPKSPRVRP
jgi:hypothetical protein